MSDKEVLEKILKEFVWLAEQELKSLNEIQATGFGVVSDNNTEYYYLLNLYGKAKELLEPAKEVK